MGDQKNNQASKAKRSRQSPASTRRSSKKQSVANTLVNLDELRDLIVLLKENGLAEFELEREGFRLHLRQGIDYQGEEATINRAASTSPSAPEAAKGIGGFASGVASAPLHPGASAETAASEDQDLHIIPSPIVGTFFRAASPNAEAFVKIGSRVDAESVVCIIEAMKLMNEIQAETSGEVVKIYVENGQPVEYGQPLFGIKK
jgi:acetyl-CoA carboxylase biotin carboxyl carrier protein